MLWLMRGGGKLVTASETPGDSDILAAVMVGLRYVWDDEPLR